MRAQDCPDYYLQQLGLGDGEAAFVQLIRAKDGVHVYRLHRGGQPLILKYFSDPRQSREIRAYELLNTLGVLTLEVIAATENALLLSDLTEHPRLRLGLAEDLADVKTAEALAEWYKQLHKAGSVYLEQGGSWAYREHDCLTEETVWLIAQRTGTEDNPVWHRIASNLHLVHGAGSRLGETLTYNDFFWTNLAVARDRSGALMFDYNYLGIGLRYSDIRNVCNSLSPAAGSAFRAAYGAYDESEKLFDDFAAVIVNLAQACTRPAFPLWAEESLRALQDGSLLRALEKLI